MYFVHTLIISLNLEYYKSIIFYLKQSSKKSVETIEGGSFYTILVHKLYFLFHRFLTQKPFLKLLITSFHQKP